MANVQNLKPIEKGKRYVGRAPGVKNMTTRVFKTALFLAAEESKHSETRGQSLKGYCVWLADEKPELFVSLLARLIPQQLKAQIQNTVHAEDIELDTNMSLPELIARFETKIKDPNYIPLPPASRPVTIDADDYDSDSDE